MNSGDLVRIHIKSSHAQVGTVTVVTSEGPVTFENGFSEVSSELGAHLLHAPASFEVVAEDASQTSQEAQGEAQASKPPPDASQEPGASPGGTQTPSKRFKR